MRRTPAWACAAYFLAGVALSGGPPAGRVPVLVELFTSEGCPDCPEADHVLEKLDREQPVYGAEVIVLSEHVDSFNGLGWADPFSLPLFLERQREYADLLKGDLAWRKKVSAPNVIVDGSIGFPGGDQGDAERAVRQALKSPKAAIRIDVQRHGGSARISLHMDQPPYGTLYLALARGAVESNVQRGPNAGRVLSLVAVAYSLREVAYGRDVTVKLQPDSRIVAFVEKAGDGSVDDAVSLSEKLLHKPIGHKGLGRVTAIGQARYPDSEPRP